MAGGSRAGRIGAAPLRSLAWAALGLLVAIPAIGADGLDLERLSLTEGLSQSTVYCILQDHLGFLWLGGENGLNRYDGYGFRHLAHDPDDAGSLASNQVRALLQDGDGRIWAATVDAGISVYDFASDRFRHHSHDPDDPGSLASDDVRDLALDAAGGVWAATAAGVDVLASGASRWRHVAIQSPPGRGAAPDAYALARSADGTVWVGAQAGLFRYAPEDDRFELPPGAAGTVDCAVAALAGDGNPVLWVGCNDAGVVGLDRSTGEVTRLRQGRDAGAGVASDFIGALWVDHRGALWIGTTDHGLDRRDPATGTIEHVDLASALRGAPRVSGVQALLEGRSHILWIGTDFAGLIKLDLKERQFEAVSARADGAGLDGQVVFAILEDRHGGMWVGTQDALLRVDRGNRALTRFAPDPTQPDRPVYALHEDDGGAIWVGTWGAGLVRLEPATGHTRVWRHRPADPTSLAHDRVLAIAPADGGRLWIGTWGGGLDLFDPATGSFAHHRVADGSGLASDRIHALRRERSGRLWVGTTGGGVSRLDPGATRFVTFLYDPDDPASLSSNDVASISEERDGAIWIATAGGLDRLDLATGHCRRYYTRHGLPSDATTGVLWGDDGRLWVAHFKGLSRFDPASETFESFDVSDGLASAEFNAGACFASPGGELFFGGVGGVTAFRPGEVTRNPYPPTAVITAVTAAGEELPLGGAVTVADTVHLRHDQDFLGFEFTGLELTFPQRNRYAHRLEGFDRGWVDAGSRRYVRYTNVPPGRYTFLVKAANNHGVWGEPARLPIVIAPPFWQTWWFRIVAAATALLLLGAVFAWRTRALRRRLATQERLVARRTSELAQANAELRLLAASDSLTGVANRRLFNEFIDTEWRRAVRFGRSMSVIMVDVDDFKAYNDSCGHQAGDSCLRMIAGGLAELVGRPGDLLARYGGEEFVVVLSETGLEPAAALAERMRRAVEELSLPHPRSFFGVVTVSLGVAAAVAAEATTWEEVVHRADEALYAAKSAGKNRVVTA